MKKTLLYLSIAALLLGACAKDPETGANDAAKRYLESWILINHPDAPQTTLGAYILDETPGTGAAAGSYDDNPFVRVRYSIRDLAGNVSYTTDETLSKQLGSYTSLGYYGPYVWDRTDHALAAGLEESLAAMRCGGTRTVVLPGWLMGVNSSTGLPLLYDTAQEYLDNVTGGSPSIYTITLEEVIPDIEKWETDSVGRYVAANLPGVTAKDSLKLGFYYQRTAAPSSEEAFHNDTTIYLNYIGRRLDGVVFDTNIADTAKFYGIYNASRTYGPSTISWYSSDGDYTEITMTAYGSSSASTTIDGFSYALDQMRPHERGTAVFYSGWGYGTRSSGDAIPSYTPLRFDLEIVDKPE